MSQKNGQKIQFLYAKLVEIGIKKGYWDILLIACDL